MDRVSSVLYRAVLGKGLKGVSTFQMSLWAAYRLGGPDLKNYEAANLDYFFNIPTYSPVVYTLKSTKFTLKHLKTLKICPYMFRSIF